MRFLHAFKGLWLGVFLAAPLLAAEATPRQKLEVTCPDHCVVFCICELKIALSPELREVAELPETQIYDAYDADRDSRYVRLSAHFSLGEKVIEVPGFAMREQPGGSWQWRIRWAPREAGQWQVSLLLEARTGPNSAPLRVEEHLPNVIVAQADDRIAGPLIAPKANELPAYLRRLKGDGTSEAAWLFGACRAWVVESQDPNNDWYPHEWLDRETELLAPMRAAGYNLLNQWMSPWEFGLVHHDRAEFWKVKGKFKRVPRPADAAWTPFQCYDQGRARAFDELVLQCEGDATKPTVYLLLAALPHQCLQVKEHPWGSQESGWSPENDAGKQSLERLNGFSAFQPKMEVWQFFEANPRQPLDDWRSKLFDHQANFYRYLIARWGYSRAIGVWVLLDELDAIGDVVGNRAEQKGWWGHPECSRWLADLLRMFRGELSRADGLKYQGDPFHHPLHAATTSFGGGAGRGGNIDWEGGPVWARPDLFGFHWYPSWPRKVQWQDVWTQTIDGVSSDSAAPIGQVPRLISEFGAPDRSSPGDEPSFLYPTLYHHAIWAAIFAGQAGTPMNWNDGKQFGELHWRERKGIFDKAHYPFALTEQVVALRRFLEGYSPENLHPCSEKNSSSTISCETQGSLRVFALCSEPKPDTIVGWLFAPKDADARFSLKGLPAGKYSLQWFNPWTGTPVPDLSLETIIVENDTARVDASKTLERLRVAAEPFPMKSRLAQGQDAAFKLRSAK